MNQRQSALDELRIDRTAPANYGLWPWIVVGVVILLVLGTGLGWLLSGARAAVVQTLTISDHSAGGQQTVLNASGYVTARRQATVSSKVTGKVVEVLFEEGLTVKEGQVLARLDTANVQANLKLAQAQLQSAKSVLEEARVQQDQAQRELQRISDLARNKIATQAELDRAQAEFDSSKARLDRQQAEVVVAERQIALWEQQMEDMIIRAPFAGVVTTKNAQPGEMISPISAGGGFTRTGIGTIVDMNSLEIEVDVNESFINRIEPGQSVTATLDSYANWPIPSKVIAIIPTADRQKATVKVRIGFEKLDPRILPDMGVKVAFQGAAETAGSSRNVTIPKAAVRQQNGRDFVWVVQKGRAELREVTLGRSQGEEVIITAGLATGEKIVVKGPEKLADGDRIKEEKQ